MSVRIGTLRTDGGVRAVSLEGDELTLLDHSVRDLISMAPGEVDAAQRRSSQKVSLDAAKGRLAPAIPDPGKIMCIGRNYLEHAQETGHTVMAKPDVFLRTRTSLCGPFDPIVIPRVSDNVDYEVELAVVIGKKGRYVAAEDAMSHVFGYTVFNDGSVRDWQLAGSQWTPGKNFDNTGPLGPFIVTADEIEDPHNLHLTTTIGGEVLQDSNTSMLMHKIPDLIAFLSSFTTLEPGDIICTGTPAGVGMARSPQRWLKAGETVVCSITGVGEISNPIVATD